MSRVRRKRSRGIRQKIARFTALTVLVAGLSSCNDDQKETAPGKDGGATSTAQTAAAGDAAAPSATADASATSAPSATAKPEEKPRFTKDPGCPEEMARVDDFCIDRWEIHLVNLDDNSIYPSNKEPPPRLPRLKAASAPNVYPQGHLSNFNAKRACTNAGKELCTQEQWEKACEGPDGNKFPYGKEKMEGMCNVGKTDFGKPGEIREECKANPDDCIPHILNLHFSDVPHAKRTLKHFNDPELLLTPGYLSQTGQHRDCMTASGIFDMDGNLSEWVATKGKPIFKGDSFSGSGNAGCGRNGEGHDGKYLDYSLGARCCQKAED